MMRATLILTLALGVLLFLHSLTIDGDVALFEALVGGLLFGTALAALVETRQVKRDHV